MYYHIIYSYFTLNVIFILLPLMFLLVLFKKSSIYCDSILEKEFREIFYNKHFIVKYYKKKIYVYIKKFIL